MEEFLPQEVFDNLGAAVVLVLVLWGVYRIIVADIATRDDLIRRLLDKLPDRKEGDE